MFQILPKGRDVGGDLGSAIGQGFQGGVNQGVGFSLQNALNQRDFQQRQQAELTKEQRQQSALQAGLKQAQQIYTNPNLSPEQKQLGLYQALSSNPEVAKSLSSSMQDLQKQQNNQEYENRLLGYLNGNQNQQKTTQNSTQPQNIEKKKQPLIKGISKLEAEQNPIPISPSQIPTKVEKDLGFNPKEIPDEAIAYAALKFPQTAKALQQMKDSANQQEKRKDDLWRADRDYQDKFSKPFLDKAFKIRDSGAIINSTLASMEDAILTGENGPFSSSAVGQAIGISGLETAAGAQLKGAIKRNWAESVQDVGGARPNVYIEQALADMLPKVGKSKWANLASFEYLKIKHDIDSQWADTYESIAQRDLDQNGFINFQNMNSRIHNEMKGWSENRQEEFVNKMKEIQKLEKLESTKSKGTIRLQNNDGMVVDIPIEEKEWLSPERKKEGWKIVK